MPRCPECGSEKTVKDGKRRLADGSTVQRYTCKNCGYRFSDPRTRQIFKVRSGITSYAATGRAVQKLVEVKEEGLKAGMREVTLNADVKGKILEYAWHLRKKGRSPETIASRVRKLKSLAKRCNILDPESVKEFLAKANWKRNTKASAVIVYSDFLKFLGKSWDPPTYRLERSFPFIPLERELDDLIACSSKRIAALLQLLKETGCRIGEAARLRWEDYDPERRVIRIGALKGSNPRIFRVSERLASMIGRLPRRNEYIFGNPNTKALRTAFDKQRKKAAYKLGNPRLLRITFHTFRHWKATMELRKTKDPWYVKQLLGHKRLESTERYIHIVRAIFGESSNDEFTVRVAKEPNEIKKLLEDGFEYVCSKEDLLFFRKRK